jgi:tRNA(fMet)-specific endonuclease VapC
MRPPLMDRSEPSWKRPGQPIGPLDIQIGAHALRLDIVLVTNNTKEFRRIKGLRVENWLG